MFGDEVKEEPIRENLFVVVVMVGRDGDLDVSEV
jgi:hypothetical protein